MSVRQYIGARYVPRFSTVNGGVWDNSYSYEALEIVKYGNDYYTSKIPVPTGIDITNTTYWVLTGNYNGAIAGLDERITANENNITNLNIKTNGIITPEMFGAVGDGVTDDIDALQDAVEYSRDNDAILIASKNYYISSALILDDTTASYYDGNQTTIIITGTLYSSGDDAIIIKGIRNNLYVARLVNRRSATGTSAIHLRKRDNEVSGLVTYNDIEFGIIKGYTYGILLDVQGNNKGIQYNTIKGNELYDIDTGIKCITTGECWCTQNIFHDMRIGGRIGIDYSDNAGAPSDNNVFDNIGLESPSYKCITLKKVNSSHFQNLRMAENTASDKLIELVDCNDNRFDGLIIIEIDKYSDTTTSPLNNSNYAIHRNHVIATRVDATRGGGWRGTEFYSYNGKICLINPFNFNFEGSIYNGTLDLSQHAIVSNVLNITNMSHDSGNIAKIILPVFAFDLMQSIRIKTTFLTGTASATVVNADSSDALLSTLQANHEYVAVRVKIGKFALANNS